MTGHIFFHLGDDSGFKAKRQNTKLPTSEWRMIVEGTLLLSQYPYKRLSTMLSPCQYPSNFIPQSTFWIPKFTIRQGFPLMLPSDRRYSAFCRSRHKANSPYLSFQLP